MEQLIKLVQEKAGISPEQAKSAVNTVLGFLKDKIPGIGPQIEGLMQGGGSNPADMAKGLGDKLGF
jgi:hypothetical protein